MSKTVHVTSPGQFTSLIQSSTIVVADFYADWCGPCKAIAPLYEQLSAQLSRPNRITFTKVNTDQQQSIAQSYKVTAMPTFLVFKNGKEVTRIRGADPSKLSDAVKKLAAEAGDSTSSSSSSSSGGFGESGAASSSASWRGLEIQRGYSDITDQVDVKDLDLLNADGEFGGARVLFETGRPSGLAGGKGKGYAGSGTSGASKDWVESDTDEQLMLYIPFQSTVKIQSLQITSLTADPAQQDDPIMRPKTIKLFTNRSHVLGFEEADDLTPTQAVELKDTDWDKKTATAKVDLRFVKFQNVTSLVVFVVDGEGTGEKVRVDRVRFVGETGEKRAMGKLAKADEDQE